MKRKQQVTNEDILRYLVLRDSSDIELRHLGRLIRQDRDYEVIDASSKRLGEMQEDIDNIKKKLNEKEG